MMLHRLRSFVSVAAAFLAESIFLLQPSPASAQRAVPPETFMTAAVSNTDPYAGEGVIFTLTLLTRLKIPLPSLTFSSSGFTEYTIEEAKHVELWRGKSYNASVLRVLLFPERPGRAVIPAQSIDLRPFIMAAGDDALSSLAGGSGSLILESEPVVLEVNPLPPIPAELAPPSSDVLVGASTTVETQLDNRVLKIGETRKLKITVTSSGNIGPLRFDAGAPSSLLTYDRPSAVSIEAAGPSPRLRKVFEWTLVPVQKGSLRIQPEGLLTFDPDTRTYDKILIAPLPLHVINPLPGSGRAGAAGDKTDNAKPPLSYRVPNLMERIVERVTLSSALLAVTIIVLSVLTVYIHLNVRKWRLREKKQLVNVLREAPDIAALSHSFRTGLVEMLSEEEKPTLSLKDLVKARVNDSELRRNIEEFLQEMASLLYSQKEVSARRLKIMKQRASVLLEDVHEAVQIP